MKTLHRVNNGLKQRNRLHRFRKLPLPPSHTHLRVNLVHGLEDELHERPLTVRWGEPLPERPGVGVHPRVAPQPLAQLLRTHVPVHFAVHLAFAVGSRIRGASTTSAKGVDSPVDGPVVFFLFCCVDGAGSDGPMAPPGNKYCSDSETTTFISSVSRPVMSQPKNKTPSPAPHPAPSTHAHARL